MLTYHSFFLLSFSSSFSSFFFLSLLPSPHVNLSLILHAFFILFNLLLMLLMLTYPSFFFSLFFVLLFIFTLPHILLSFSHFFVCLRLTYSSPTPSFPGIFQLSLSLSRTWNSDIFLCTLRSHNLHLDLVGKPIFSGRLCLDFFEKI